MKKEERQSKLTAFSLLAVAVAVAGAVALLVVVAAAVVVVTVFCHYTCDVAPITCYPLLSSDIKTNVLDRYE